MEIYLIHSFVTFFFFWLIAYSTALADLRDFIKDKLPDWLNYPLFECAFCFSFWAQIIWAVFGTFTTGIFVVPVLCLFLQSLLIKLARG